MGKCMNYLNLMYPSGTGSSFMSLMEACSFCFFCSGVKLSSSKMLVRGLEAPLLLENPGSPGIRVRGCLEGS